MQSVISDLPLKAQASLGPPIDPGPIPEPSDIPVLISSIITLAYTFSAIAAVAYVIYAGFSIMSAGGDPQKLKKGQDTLVYAIAGLILVLCAGIIIEFVARLLGVDGGIFNLPF